MKIGIIGNSHLAALYYGEKNTAHEHHIEYWGRFSARFSEIVRVDGAHINGLRKLSQLGSSEDMVFNGKNFDIVFIYAQSLNLQDFAQSIASINGGSFSSAFTKRYYEELFSGIFAFKCTQELRNAGVKVCIYAAPAESETGPTPYLPLDDMLKFIQPYLDGLGVSLNTQPKNTLTETGKTKQKYLTDNFHFDGSLRKNDYVHMNALYGEVILNDIIALAEQA